MPYCKTLRLRLNPGTTTWWGKPHGFPQPMPTKTLLLWLALIATFLTLDYRLDHADRFLDPARVQRIAITQKDSAITLERGNGGWTGDGKLVRPGRAEQMLDILATCHSPQPLADLKAPPNPRPLILPLVLILWSGLLAAFATLDYRLDHADRFLDPARVQRIAITQKDSAITLERRTDGWRGDGKPIRPGRAEQMLDILASCHSPQPLADLKAPPNPRPLTLTLDDKPYTLGGYNTYHHAHYLDDGTTVWLCSENLKAMLAQPPASWYPAAENPS